MENKKKKKLTVECFYYALVGCDFMLWMMHGLNTSLERQASECQGEAYK